MRTFEYCLTYVQHSIYSLLHWCRDQVELLLIFLGMLKQNGVSLIWLSTFDLKSHQTFALFQIPFVSKLCNLIFYLLTGIVYPRAASLGVV